MRSTDDVADNVERTRALDVSTSFIVRAPAGSGKTRLLIQRYLALLACADEPEEVIAITFTRKAASEMRARVQAALAAAGGTGEGVDALTLTLAGKVLARDALRGWALTSCSQRLRMQTIDALNASLTRQMAMTSRFGAQPESLEDATVLYHDAARRLLAQVNDATDDESAMQIADDIATLLAHLDNNLDLVEGLLADMLASRDHWLRKLRGMDQRAALESALASVRARAVTTIATLFAPECESETLALVRFSGQNLLKEGADRALSRCADMPTFPDADVASLPSWLAVVELLLTKDGTWRKANGINKKLGFPTSTDKQEKAALGQMKTRLVALIDDLSAEPAWADTLVAALLALRTLPPPCYSEAQWHVLGAIVRLLPRATALLWEAFGAAGQCDFSEIAQAASRALGDEDAPTDLALSLDYRVRHLLVDEFQDTSFAQFELLEKLTRGWSPDDGRTLFVVGDPMQSIYRFREAEVGLFLRAAQFGIGNVLLEPLTLRVNFRSTPAIVEWVNQTFGQLMPRADVASAAVVPYAACEAYLAPEARDDGATEVKLHWQVRPLGANQLDATDASEDEAAQIVSIIRQAQSVAPEQSIAILIRNRSHISAIVPALKTAGIAYQAVDIDPLKERPVVQDLLALTRALLHLSDRIAWLAVLRAPWCGLTLNDLAALVNGAEPQQGSLTADARTIWEMIRDDMRVSVLSDDGAARVMHFREVMSATLARRRRLPLRDAVEQTWLALAGPACLSDANQLADAQTFLDLLDVETKAQATGGQIGDLSLLEMRMQRLFSGNLTASAQTAAMVQIMTIHKAKGLEFDTVIVPGLARFPRNDDKRLMVWTEQPNPQTGERELLLAPIRETGREDEDDIYRYISALERAKQQHEEVRLLYVAATRAARNLHLFAAVSVKPNGLEATIVPPRAGSLLASLWPAVEADAQRAVVLPLSSEVRLDRAPDPRHDRHQGRPVPHGSPARRLTAKIRQPLLPSAVEWGLWRMPTDAALQDLAVDFDWASDTARHVGTIVHALLQRIAEDGVAQWDAARVAAASPLFERELLRRGVAADRRGDAIARISRALTQTLIDARGRWILQSHRAARCEWRLTGMVRDAPMSVAIDRTFIDDDGVRWIIDFKTGSHEGANIEAFLDSEQQRYHAQLETYKQLVGALSNEDAQVPIKLGLYFPLLCGWREWQ